MSQHAKRIRLIIRFFCLLVAVLFLLPVFEQKKLLPVIPAVSPFVSIISSIASRKVCLYSLLGFLVGVIIVIRHRCFCRWMCPSGLCMDAAGALGKRCHRKSIRFIPVGQWLVFLTLGGAIVGYPLFLWLDPLALFSNVIHSADAAAQSSERILASAFVIIWIICFIWPDLWCRRICPLGATQDLVTRLSRFVKKHVTASQENDTASKTSSLIQRRVLLGMGLGIVGAKALHLKAGGSAKPLRPPGAVGEKRFNGLCIRCGSCIEACPYDIIQSHTDLRDWPGLLTPVLRYDHDYCHEDCNDCTTVCPSGALSAVQLDLKNRVQIGLARVDMSICLLGRDRECSACQRWCPYDAIYYRFSELEYTLVPVINAEKCNGCGACQNACPTHPQKAILVLYPV